MCALLTVGLGVCVIGLFFVCVCVCASPALSAVQNSSNLVLIRRGGDCEFLIMSCKVWAKMTFIFHFFLPYYMKTWLQCIILKVEEQDCCQRFCKTAFRLFAAFKGTTLWDLSPLEVQGSLYCFFFTLINMHPAPMGQCQAVQQFSNGCYSWHCKSCVALGLRNTFPCNQSLQKGLLQIIAMMHIIVSWIVSPQFEPLGLKKTKKLQKAISV